MLIGLPYMTRKHLIKYLEDGKCLGSDVGGWYILGGQRKKIPVETCDYLQNNLDLSEITIKGKYFIYYQICLSGMIEEIAKSKSIINIRKL